MKAVAGFGAGFCYRAHHFLQPLQALFVAGRYDLPEYIRQFLKELHRLAAQQRFAHL